MIKATIENGQCSVQAAGTPEMLSAELGAFTCSMFERIMELTPPPNRSMIATSILSGIGFMAAETLDKMGVTIPATAQDAARESWRKAKALDRILRGGASEKDAPPKR